MRVFMESFYLVEHGEGISNYIKELRNYLIKEDVLDGFSAPKFDVYTRAIYPRAAFKLYRQLQILSKEFLVHVHFPIISATIPFKTILSKFARSVIQIWNPPYVDRSFDLSHFMFNSEKVSSLVSKRLKSPIIVSSLYLQRILRNMGADDVSYIPAGINAERFSANPDFERCITNEAVVIYYGHLTKWKGVENLIEAMPLVISEYPRAKLKVMWTGHGRSYKKVMALIGQLKLSKHVVVNNTICKDIPSFLKHADIGVLPLRSSNATANPPRTLLEMMSAGLPTVATNIGGVSEIIKHRETGILVDPSPESIANGILSLLFNKSLADKISRAAQDYIKANHDWSQIGPIYTKFYEELI